MAGANADLFDAYFKRADLDGDGQISGAEAVAFFQGSGLPKQVLAQVWMYADHRKVGYLGRQEFYNALKLVTVAQNKRDLTPDIVKAALYSPASAKIPAPQINLAATPAPRVAPPAPQSTGVASQNVGARPPQVPGNVNANRQYLPSQQNQLAGVASQNVGIRPSQSMPPGSVSLPQQILASQGMPSGGPMTAPRPPNSNTTTDLLGGNTGGSVSLTVNRGISPPVNKDGFGLTTSGVTPYVQPRPPAATGQMPSASLKPQDADKLPNQTASNDSKTENGFAADSLFGDVFSANPAQPKQGNVSGALPASSLPASSASAPSSVGPQPSTKPGLHDSSQSTFSQQPVSSQPTGGQRQQAPAQRINAPPSTGFPVGAGNLAAPGQSQHSWPKMTQSAIQKYMKVFVQVDTDRDGKISGEQARNLFLSWRLPREVLKQVWDLSDQDNDSMLSLKEFCTALYLMERYREGRPLPATLPSTLMSDETLLSATSHPTSFHGSGAWGPSSGPRPPQVPTGARPAPAARPPRPPTVPHADEKPPSHQKPKVPVLEMHLVDQLSQVEQDSLNSKFQDAEQADKKVEELEKEIVESRQKIEFYRVKMQELILYKSRCDNRLNEVTARVAADKREAEVLARKYEEKYKQTGDVASKLTIEEATFRDIQERKMELYRAIVKLEEGGAADGVIKERAENIRSGLEELVKNVSERCKQYGLRSKPTSLFELPFGWQPGIQEGAADWDEDWDKFEDEGFSFVKELTLDVKNVVAPPKPISSPVQKEASARKEDAEAMSDKVPSSDKPITDKAHEHNENGVAKSPPESPAGKSPTESHSHEFRDSPFRESTGADSSLHAKENQSDVGGAESGHSGDKSANEPSWGTFDSHYDTESVWGFDKDMDHEKHGESSIFGLGEFNLNPIKTGSSGVDNMFKGKNSSIFADSVPSTPAYNPGHSAFPFADSVPSTPAYNQGKNSYLFADSVPSTPAYNQGTSPFTFADSVPGTPAYNFGNSPRRFSEGSEDHSFDTFSRFDSFSIHDGGLFQSPRHSLSRFDSMRSTRDSDQNYGLPSRFDSFKESGDFDQGFSRFDSFRESDQSHGFSRFDSFRESEQSHGFPSRFDSFREPRDTEHRDEFSRFDSFNTHDSGFFQSSGSSFDRFDSVRGSREPDNNRGFSSFDETDPFGSSVPFRTSLESETPRKSTDDWKAF